MNLFRPQSYNYYHSYANGFGEKEKLQHFFIGIIVYDRVKGLVKNYY